jgi:hypothetical protein
MSRIERSDRLWELAAVNLLLQGYVHTDCQVLLESPLLTWRRMNFLLPLNPVPIDFLVLILDILWLEYQIG